MKKIIPALVFVFTFFLVISPTPAFAENLKIKPSIDTYIMQSAPNGSFSGLQDMRVFVDKNNHDDRAEALLQFPLGAIPPKAVLKKATLEINVTGTSSERDAERIDVFPIVGNWDSHVTWATKPEGRGGNFSIYSQLDKKLGYRTWDMTPLVKLWLDGTAANKGFYLKADRYDHSFSFHFASTENNFSDERDPFLNIEYTLPNAGINVSGRNISVVVPKLPGSIGVINVPNLNLLTISEIQIENVTTTGATVKWKTSKNATSWVFYGDATNGDKFDKQTGKDDSTIDHSVDLTNLTPNTKYSIKVMSKDDKNQQTFGKIIYLTTLNNEGQNNPAPTPEAADNPIAALQEKIENKVADLAIDSALSGDNIANETSGSGQEVHESALTAKGPISLIAGFVGINKLAGFLFIILSVMFFVGALILFILTKRVHHHIKKRLSKRKR